MRISDWSSDVCSSDLPASWWIVALEYALYFFLFDTYFYWLHRWMHQPLVYRWIHKLHHRSVSPNLLTTLSVSPLESIINGGFVPMFLAVFRSEEHTSELQSLMRNSYAVFCLKKKKK